MRPLCLPTTVTTGLSMPSDDCTPARVELANFIAAEIESLIVRLDPSARKPALTTVGVLAGALVATFLELPRRKQFALSAKATALVEQIEQLVAMAAAAAPAREISKFGPRSRRGA